MLVALKTIASIDISRYIYRKTIVFDTNLAVICTNLANYGAPPCRWRMDKNAKLYEVNGGLNGKINTNAGFQWEHLDTIDESCSRK